MAQTNLNHITVKYTFDGPDDGQVIMLSNSLASNLTMWDPQIAALTGLGLRVLRYDTRGHGGTSPTAGPYTMQMLSDDALALLDELDLDQVCFMGCSMGGMIGQMLTTLHPQRVRALVLAATACHMPAPEVWDQRIATVRAGGMEAVADGTIDRWFTKAGQARMSQTVARVRAMVAHTLPGGFCSCAEAIRDMDQRDGIKSITAPTLIIVGEQDPGTPVSAAREIHARIAGSRLEIIPDAAHFVNMERADVFNAAVTAFLKPLL